MRNKKFKLLFLSSDKYPPFRVDVKELFAEKLSSRGHVIDFILQSEDDCASTHEEKWLNCRVIVGKTDNGLQWYARVKKHIYSLLLDLKSVFFISASRYDFVQLKDKYLSSIYIMPVCKLLRTKFIYWLSYPFPEDSLYKSKEPNANYPVFYWLRGHIFDFIFYRFIAKYADFIFVQSEQMKLDLIARGVPGDKLLPVPMGISIEKFPTVETINATSPEPLTVLYLGTLYRVRRMDFLIRAFALVIKVIPDARLQMVGGGEDELDIQLLKDEVHKLGLDNNVLFTGMLPMADALKYVAKASVCVSPFYPTAILNSTSPTKLVEYMAMGKPVVANDHPEQKLVIESSGAGICVPYDEQEFANAIITLLNDPSRCLVMGRAGRNYVEKHRTYDHIADIVEQQYLTLITNKS